MDLYKLIVYLKNNHIEEDERFPLRKALLVDRGDGQGTVIVDWQYDIKKPSIEDLNHISDDDVKREFFHRRLRRQLKSTIIVSLSSIDVSQILETLETGMIWYNTTEQCLQYYDGAFIKTLVNDGDFPK